MGLLQGTYEIRHEISRGMEIAYLGWDTRLGRPVFIKEFTIPQGASRTSVEHMRRRFHSEAVVGALIDHPNVVKTLDAFDEDGRTFIVLEYVHGKPLSVVIEERGPLPLLEAIEITLQVLDALDTAGEAGVVHGDIKPGNILLTDEGQVKIVDFGIAVREGERAPQRAGTPNYMAPEQLRGRPLDRRADLFSAAVVLYHLASGQRPFGADTVKGILDRIEYEEPKMPAEWSPEFCSVLRKGLAKEPGARYQSANLMASDLRAVAERERRARPVEETGAVRSLMVRLAVERGVGVLLVLVSAAAVSALVLVARLGPGP